MNAPAVFGEDHARAGRDATAIAAGRCRVQVAGDHPGTTCEAARLTGGRSHRTTKTQLPPLPGARCPASPAPTRHPAQPLADHHSIRTAALVGHRAPADRS